MADEPMLRWSHVLLPGCKAAFVREAKARFAPGEYNSGKTERRLFLGAWAGMTHSTALFRGARSSFDPTI